MAATMPPRTPFLSLLLRLVSSVGLLVVAACATVSGGAGDPDVRCEQRTAEVFALSGGTDAVLLACVEQTLQPTTRELILDSPGGDVAVALDIAAHFEGRNLSMRVAGECNSSCANYFLPLAGRIVVEPGSYIIQHGSIDPQFVARMEAERAERIASAIAGGETAGEAEARYDRFLESTRALSLRQDAFAQRNRIPRGWLFYRHPGSNEIEGMQGGPTGPGRRGVLVEEPLLSSCLSHIDIEPYDTRRYGPLLDPIYTALLAIRGMPRSGTMRCVA